MKKATPRGWPFFLWAKSDFWWANSDEVVSGGPQTPLLDDGYHELSRGLGLYFGLSVYHLCGLLSRRQEGVG